ncbi:MAG TPA: diguanylate cyclase [Terracidiphilus sp.]|jgi:diguanylate cyclase (GGDEF)-like protein|nr:diguanylate cyclase [Terracidiphilus sp.]
MAERQEMMEAALDCLSEGVALLDEFGHVVFWNRAAESVTGFPGIDIVGRAIPWEVEPLLIPENAAAHGDGRAGGGLAHVHHRQGHELAAMVRSHVLRDGLGQRIGHAAVFRPAEDWDALPHGYISAGSEAGETQARLEERVEERFREFARDGAPMGLIWISVDQARGLRRTHGARASEAMLVRVERTLANGLHAPEEIGRWGDDEFLVLAHAATAEALAARAQTLAGQARTTDFRWWGDRITFTVSVGAALAERDEILVRLLERAQAAMHASAHAGGNHITLAPGRRACSPL